jgi:general secretion pathway protein C
MMKRLLDRHEWAVDLAAAVLCASALAHAYAVALERPRSPAPPAMVIAAAQAEPRQRDQWGIRKVGEHAYEIEGRAGALMADWVTPLSRSARIVPEIRDGHAVGFRLYSVREDGPLAWLGLRNGDVIRTINDRELNSPEKALELYARLKSADHFVVSFERNGLTLSNEYRLR